MAALVLPKVVDAIHAEDVGTLDFLVATTGHGVTRFVQSFEDSILTSDFSSSSSEKSTSCYVASRKIEDGSLLWRRNVCSTPSADQHHAIATSGENFYTMDDSGIVRAWAMRGGNLLWDAQMSPSTRPKVWAFSKDGKDFVAAASDEEFSIFQAGTGKPFDTINAIVALQQTSYKLKNGEGAQWLSVLPNDSSTTTGPLRALLGFVKNGITSGSRMVMIELELGDDQVVSSKSLNHVKSSLVASSIQVQQVDQQWHALGLTTESSSAVHFSLENAQASNDIPASGWHPKWTSVTSVAPTPVASVISLKGIDSESRETMSLYRFDDATKSGWEKLHGLEEPEDIQFNAISYCPEAGLVLAMTSDSLKVYRHDSLSNQADAGSNRHERLSPLSPMTVTGDLFVPDGDSVEGFSVIACSRDAVTTLLSTTSGTTTQLSFTLTDQAVTAKVGWSSEEGLASVSSAVILDASHLGVDDLAEEQDVVMRKLSLSSRLSSQLSGIASVFSGGESGRRDHLFGFVKVAAVLSQKSHRIWGVNTSGDAQGTVRWSLDLPKAADWHTMVHGTTNSAKAVHGINGGSHSREILVLSSSPSSVDWKCIDGTNGAVHAQETVATSSPVAQVIPMYGSLGGGCRQASLLLHEDLTLSIVPDDKDTVALVQQQLKNTPNGLFTHLVDKPGSKVESFQVTQESGALVSRKVGQSFFTDERIVKVAYPTRDEIVQSLCTILGDESLLLKYVNPHLAVVVTMSTEEKQSATKLSSSIEKSQGTKTGKPRGVGDSATAEPESEEVPNLFVNLVDTVSGRVLHRASHLNADPSRDVVAMISENWILYTFVNAKTRRTELGVLTLHEGMVHNKALSLFSSPEQTTTFSSFDTRESKPIVLAKTYTFPKAITALGATATRGGISSRKIIVASADGKITAIDRHMLETRRPMGEVKAIEKKEGLFP